MAPDCVRSPSPSIRRARPKSVTCGCVALVDQDVRRLQVAMEDSALMGVVHRLRDDRDQPGRGADVVG